MSDMPRDRILVRLSIRLMPGAGPAAQQHTACSAHISSAQGSRLVTDPTSSSEARCLYVDANIAMHRVTCDADGMHKVSAAVPEACCRKLHSELIHPHFLGGKDEDVTSVDQQWQLVLQPPELGYCLHHSHYLRSHHLMIEMATRQACSTS